MLTCSPSRTFPGLFPAHPDSPQKMMTRKTTNLIYDHPTNGPLRRTAIYHLFERGVFRHRSASTSCAPREIPIQTPERFRLNSAVVQEWDRYVSPASGRPPYRVSASQPSDVYRNSSSFPISEDPPRSLLSHSKAAETQVLG